MENNVVKIADTLLLASIFNIQLLAIPLHAPPQRNSRRGLVEA
jgi:hypothetical protein